MLNYIGKPHGRQFIGAVVTPEIKTISRYIPSRYFRLWYNHPNFWNQERNRANQAFITLLYYRRNYSCYGYLFRQPGKKPGRRFHRLFAKHKPHNPVHHLHCQRYTISSFLCQKHADSAAALGSLCRDCYLAPAPSRPDTNDGHKRWGLSDTGPSYHEAGLKILPDANYS
jgi:hypothetical protein